MKLQEISGEGKPWISIFLFTEDPLLAMKTSPRIDWAFQQRFSSSNTSLHDLCACKYTSNEHMIDIIGDKNGHNGRQRTRDTASYKASTYFKQCTHCYCAMKWLTVNSTVQHWFSSIFVQMLEKPMKSQLTCSPNPLIQSKTRIQLLSNSRAQTGDQQNPWRKQLKTTASNNNFQNIDNEIIALKHKTLTSAKCLQGPKSFTNGKVYCFMHEQQLCQNAWLACNEEEQQQFKTLQLDLDAQVSCQIFLPVFLQYSSNLYATFSLKKTKTSATFSFKKKRRLSQCKERKHFFS